MKTIAPIPLILLSLLWLAGCASTVDSTPVPSPPLEQVRADFGGFEGLPVRWGGQIARVENLPQQTLVEVVEHPLGRNGRPRLSRDSGGRFLVRVPGFLDPAVYAQGRPFTVSGTLTGQLERQIGQYPYTFPVVAADSYRLWEKEPEREVIFYPSYDLYYWNGLHPRIGWGLHYWD